MFLMPLTAFCCCVFGSIRWRWTATNWVAVLVKYPNSLKIVPSLYMMKAKGSKRQE